MLDEKDDSRNISMELFQNLTSGSKEEEFLRISSCPYSAYSQPCFLTYQNFANHFENSHPRNISTKLFQNLTCGLTEDFL